MINDRIRFAAPPIGVRRWHAPTDPDTNRSAIINATSYGSRCPQAYPAPFTGNSFTTPPLDPTIITADPYFQTVIQGSEDCLFLNIYAPPQAKNLPVLVWIHGGGYGFGHGTQDLSPIINASSNGFVGVSIQYRVCICITSFCPPSSPFRLFCFVNDFTIVTLPSNPSGFSPFTSNVDPTTDNLS